MSGLMEFYTRDYAASEQIGKNVYRRVSIPIDDFNAACDHYGFVLERTCELTLDGTDGCFGCSECDENIPPLANYCPNCGAKVVSE